MDKIKLIEIKKRLLAIGLVGVMFGTSGCTSKKDENGVPKYVYISSIYSNVDDYYKNVMQNGETVKLYNSSNVYLLFNKETYEVSEYIYYGKDTLGGLRRHVELYDLTNGNMLVYSDSMNTTYNKEYYDYIKENNYQVCLAEASNYVEGHIDKNYYLLDEIRELEPQIAESLKKINSNKVKTK